MWKNKENMEIKLKKLGSPPPPKKKFTAHGSAMGEKELLKLEIHVFVIVVN